MSLSILAKLKYQFLKKKHVFIFNLSIFKYAIQKMLYFVQYAEVIVVSML